jgi:Zn finger protein HypA/HybF involved in hydrogenase expression
MHEFIAAKRILDEARAQGKPTNLKIAVGELAPFTADELVLALKKAAPDVKVDISVKESEVSCGCGFKGRPKITGREEEFVFFTCPKCGKEPKVHSGEEVILEEVLVEKQEQSVPEK